MIYKDQKKTKAPLTHKPEKEAVGHLVTEIDMLGSMPSSRSRRGIAGEEEVTFLHGTHGPVELKGSYSYELPLLVWFVVCTLTFYFWSCLVPKNFHHKLSYRILRHMHGALNVDEKKLITQLVRNRLTKLSNLISP